MRKKQARGQSSFARHKRLSVEIQKSLSQLLFEEHKPIHGTFITRVEMNKDCRVANVFVRPAMLGEEQGDEVKISDQQWLTLLKGKSGMYRSRLGKIMHIRYSPEIRFHYDVGIDHQFLVEDLLKN